MTYPQMYLFVSSGMLALEYRRSTVIGARGRSGDGEMGRGRRPGPFKGRCLRVGTEYILAHSGRSTYLTQYCVS